jgi:hypothetical protein
MPEAYKMFRDNGFGETVLKEDLMAIIRKVNYQVKKEREPDKLSLAVFDVFLMNIALHVFSKPPQDYHHLPFPQIFELLMQKFRDYSKSKGESLIIFDEPEMAGCGDPVLLRHLSKTVQEDPDAELPPVKIYRTNLIT